MPYRRVEFERPPPMFDLRVRHSMAHLAACGAVPLPPPALMPRLRHVVESLLHVKNMPPTPACIGTLTAHFTQLVALSRTGKPILDQKRDSLSLLFDVFALQSEMSLEHPDDLVLGYTQSMMGFLLFNPTPKAIGVIGLGGGSLVKFCHRYVSGAVVAAAEIDPQVIALRAQFRIPPDDERLEVHCMDGAEFVRQASSRFDVLMVDGFDRRGQPPQLCSERFYGDCYQALTPGGMMVVNLLGDMAETQRLIDRIHIAFQGNLVVVQAIDSSNKVVFAGKGAVLQVPDHLLTSRIDKLELLHPVPLRPTAQRILEQRHGMRSHVPSIHAPCPHSPSTLRTPT